MAAGRLAPTPSGHLHLGNALAFGAAWLSARAAGARVLLRVEDLDRGRARDDIAASQREDLRWLGLDWDEEVLPQSRRTYALDGIPVFRCVCTRATRLYLGCSCRHKAHDRGHFRFDTPRGPVAFVDRAQGPQVFDPDEDPILVREDGEVAYPLAVVFDDHRDGVTEVVRGGDLLPATATQIRLYELLGWAPPTWLHAPVILGADGKKLSKSHGSTELRALREAGWTAERVWDTILPLLGLRHFDPVGFDAHKVCSGTFVVDAAGGILAPPG
ncbi:MAG: tRNA glutamyl-Q(34) synthetase GluQRS [Deltaproteobacteria bacterium]|nr:tRNA glutamyl-Q(34) synthetase GluQRS [Deltaproteobacteria bacterium]